MIVSNTVFLWFCTFMVLGLAVIWTLWDGNLVRRLWSTRKENHDEFFGALIGLVIMIIGVTGVYLHHQAL
jgi:hypothetical protein